MTKICNKCKIEKPLSEFYKHSKTKDKVDYRCKICTNKCRADNWLKSEYGLTREQYNNILFHQYYCCAICGCVLDMSEATKSCVDHNHKTGEVRGILCWKCNVGIGHLKEDIKILKGAIKYLTPFF